MGEITIKSANRKWENRSWIKVYNCFASNFFSKSESNPNENKFSLKEVNIKPNMGFVPRSHKNKDFIIIPIQGSLVQKNNLGQSYKARKGHIHLMSTGTGITHFEYNQSSTEDLNYVVFDILPNEKNKEPKCLTVSLNSLVNQLEKIIPIDKKTGQQALMNNVTAYYGEYEKEFNMNFNPTNLSNKILVYVIKGSILINGKLIKPKDTFGIHSESSLKITTKEPSQILLFEILN